MSNFKKVLKVGIALLVVILLSSFGVILKDENNKAQVISGTQINVFSVFNRNEIVLEAQIILKDLGLYNGKTSGVFGFKTRDALFAYQRSVGLSQTGILDIPTQQKLFAPPPPPQIEYTLVDHTKRGEIFLGEWVQYMTGEKTDMTQLQGMLVPSTEKIVYGDHVEMSTHRLVTESGEYHVQNISDKSLEVFSDMNVTVVGYRIENPNGYGLPVMVINYILEDLNLEQYQPIGYTEDGNFSAKNWVRKAYDVTGEYIEEWGKVTIYRPMQYNGNSYPTSIILRTDRAKYAIENISSEDLKRLEGETISLRGFLLPGTNEEGYPTIVINYLQ